MLYRHLLHLRALIVAILAALPCSAIACSIAGAGLFNPTLQRFEAHPGPRQMPGAETGDYWEKVPAPIVHVVSIKRGTAPAGSTCDDAGILVLAIELPPASTYRIDQFGVYFRVLDGKLPDEIFPTVPMIGVVQNNVMSLAFPWLDGLPSKQVHLNLKVEAFLVTNGLDIGPSTIFEVRD